MFNRSVQYTNPGEHTSLDCEICNSPMGVDRNITCARQPHGTPQPTDVFTCPYEDEKWHDHVAEMMEWRDKCPSPSLKKIVQDDINATLAYCTKKD